MTSPVGVPSKHDSSSSVGAGQSGPTSALPSVLARVAAFVSIFVGAGAAGLIGHTFAELGGYSGLMIGLITFLAMVLGAGGVAVVAVLTLRAFGEWETIRDNQA